MIPEPTTVAKSIKVPSASATNLRAISVIEFRLSCETASLRSRNEHCVATTLDPIDSVGGRAS